jgi:hypothetical protein
MAVEVEAKRNQLMGALAEHDLIKAALIVDISGAVKASVGSARALAGPDGTDAYVTAEGTPRSRENVYLAAVDNDFLVAIFDDGIDFDTIKADVDRLLSDLDF